MNKNRRNRQQYGTRERKSRCEEDAINVRGGNENPANSELIIAERITLFFTTKNNILFEMLQHLTYEFKINS